MSDATNKKTNSGNSSGGKGGPSRRNDGIASEAEMRSLNELFSPGPKSEGAPKAPIEREAVHALRGYAYQLAATALAWLDLASSERLYLEVAEDYAVSAGDALKAVQVKDTAQSGKVTLLSADVRETITNFVKLVDANPSRQVSLLFLSTSEIGIERKKDDRPAGEPGLKYWRNAAAGADVEPLRAALLRADMPAEVKAFVQARDDASLRTDLLKRIRWECGSPDFEQTRTELVQVIAKIGRERFGLVASSAEQLAYVIMYSVLQRAIVNNREQRFLVSEELDALFDAASRVSVRQTDIDKLLGNLAKSVSGRQSGALTPNNRPPWITLNDELLDPALLVERQELEAKICEELGKSSCVVLAGATGLGKTLLARRVAMRLEKKFALVDFRDLDAAGIYERIDALIPALHGLRVDAVILDDLNHLEEPKAKAAFGRILVSLRQRDQIAIVTCYRRPSIQLAADLAIATDGVQDVPYFTEHETANMVRQAGGDPATWGRLAMMAGGGGHPQLVRAFVLGAASRKWPKEEYEKTIAAGFSSPDIDASREEARRRLIAALPQPNQHLLFRLSLAIGSFVRDLADTVGGVSPRLSQPGGLLDGLAGVWVEMLDGKRYRVSPLVHNAGAQILDADEIRAVHSAIAKFQLKDRSLSIADADAIFAHGLLGHDKHVLMALAQATMSASQEILEGLAEYSISFRGMQTERELFPEVPAVSVMLRLAQCKVVLAKGKREKLDASLEALFREIDAMDEPARSGIESIALMNLLPAEGMNGSREQWLGLVQRLRKLLIGTPTLRNLIKSIGPPKGQENRTLVGTMFIWGMIRLPSVARLQSLLHQMDKLPEGERNELLADCEADPSEYDLIVSGAWLSEHRNGKLDWSDAAERYLELAGLADRWNRPELAAYCHKARAVMFDEYGNNADAALASLAQAAEMLGDNAILLREQVKVYWRADDHRKVVEIISPVADGIAKNHPVERMFVMREAAISAAHVDDWPLSARWFAAAREAIAGNPAFRPTAIGLTIDEAISYFEAGDRVRCLKLMSEAMSRLPEIEDDPSLKSVYTQHLARHASLWVKLQCDHRNWLSLPFEIIWRPGTGSNPEPLEVIREKPLGPVDITWYLLAEAEVLSGVDAGIVSGLRSHLRSGPIPFQEVSLRKRQIDAAILAADPRSFARRFKPHLEGSAFLRSLGPEGYKQFDAMNPRRGELPPISPSALEQSESAQADAAETILAFLIVEVLASRYDELSKLELELASELGSSFAGRAIFARLRNEGSPLTPTIEEVIRITLIMKGGQHLVPVEICGVALRFSEFVLFSNFKHELTPLLVSWFENHWRRILEHERFRLKLPALHVPRIEQALSADVPLEQKFASLLLVTCEATDFPLADQYRRVLLERTSIPVGPKD